MTSLENSKSIQIKLKQKSIKNLNLDIISEKQDFPSPINKKIERLAIPQLNNKIDLKLSKSRSGRIRRKAKSPDHPLIKLMLKSENNSNSKKKRQGCNCTNTKCVQMYCRCFKNDNFCGSKCKCTNCMNRQSNDKIRSTMKNVLVDKDELSFLKRFPIMKVTVIKESGDQVVEGR